MTDKTPSDDLTELEPLEPHDLPELPSAAKVEGGLPELPELTELEPLPELPELAELPAVAERVDPPAAPPPAPSPMPAAAPPRRVAPPAPQPVAARAAASPPPPPSPPRAPSPPPAARPAPAPARPSVPAAEPAGGAFAAAPEPARPAAQAPSPQASASGPQGAGPGPGAGPPPPLDPLGAGPSHAGGGAPSEPPRPPGDLAAAPAAPSPLAGDPPVPLAGAAPPPSGPSDAPPGERPPLRPLDKAPAHLKTAAAVVVAGSALPWMGHGGGVVTSVVAKVLVLVAAWLWLKQIDHNWGPKLGGALGKLADLVLKPAPKDGGKKKRSRSQAAGPASLEHPFPTALHVLSLVVALAACAVLPSVDGLAGGALGKAVAELGMLAWAAYTWVHIYSYQRWGSFNPIFPMMFLAMLFAGLLMLATGFGTEQGGLTKASMIVGGLVVGIGGGIAAYTIVEAMLAAKKEGDAKKAAALEARRAARKGGK